MPLRLLLDEDIKSKILVRLLRERGHDVVTTADLDLDGQVDSTVLRASVETDRTILTYDCDDFRTLHAGNDSHPGILLVYQELGKSLSREGIVRALDDLERSGVPIADALHALNAWRY